MAWGAALGFLIFEVAILAGGLWWTFRRAQLPVGVLGAAALSTLVGLSQALLVIVVEVGVDLALERPVSLGMARGFHGVSLALGALAVFVAAPLALRHYLKLDARWTRALTRELIAGALASGLAALFVVGVALITGALIAGLVSAF